MMGEQNYQKENQPAFQRKKNMARKCNANAKVKGALLTANCVPTGTGSIFSSRLYTITSIRWKRRMEKKKYHCKDRVGVWKLITYFIFGVQLFFLQKKNSAATLRYYADISSSTFVTQTRINSAQASGTNPLICCYSNKIQGQCNAPPLPITSIA